MSCYLSRNILAQIDNPLQYLCMFFMLSSDKNARSSCQHSSYVYNKKNNLWDITRYTFAMQFICIQQYFISLVLLLVSNYLLSILQLVNCTKHEIQTNVNLIWSFIQFVIKVIEEPKRHDELIITVHNQLNRFFNSFILLRYSYSYSS